MQISFPILASAPARSPVVSEEGARLRAVRTDLASYACQWILTQVNFFWKLWSQSRHEFWLIGSSCHTMSCFIVIWLSHTRCGNRLFLGISLLGSVHGERMVSRNVLFVLPVIKTSFPGNLRILWRTFSPPPLSSFLPCWMPLWVPTPRLSPWAPLSGSCSTGRVCGSALNRQPLFWLVWVQKYKQEQTVTVCLGASAGHFYSQKMHFVCKLPGNLASLKHSPADVILLLTNILELYT